MNPRRFIVVAALLLTAAWPVREARAQGKLLDSFQVVDVVFAPQASAGKDSALVRWQLADTAATIAVFVLAADSSTVVDTLYATVFDTLLAQREARWGGTFANGTPAPEGRYIVSLSATGIDAPDTTVSRSVFIDRTRPVISIVNVTPAPFAPNSPTQSKTLVVRFDVSNSSPLHPDRSADELQVAFTSPIGGTMLPDTLNFVPPLYDTAPFRIGADGQYEMKWDVGGQTGIFRDGINKVTLTVIDEAFSLDQPSVASAEYDVDITAPELEVTSQPGGSFFAALPDSISGFAFDRAGIDSLRVRYDSGKLTDVSNRYVRNDTVFFSVPARDSLSGEGAHTITLRASDPVRHSKQLHFDLTLDTTAPPAPVLDPFDGVSHTDTYRLTGGFAQLNETYARIRIFENSIQVDSFFTLVKDTIDVLVPLTVGVNVFTATLVDEAGNSSAPSNAVRVVFDNGAGVFIPAPFIPGERFLVNTTRAANAVKIRLFDLAGRFVHELVHEQASTKLFTMDWDGLNHNGRPVRKGPLVAVVEIVYTDATTEIKRETFLYDPR